MWIKEGSGEKYFNCGMFEHIVQHCRNSREMREET